MEAIEVGALGSSLKSCLGKFHKSHRKKPAVESFFRWILQNFSELLFLEKHPDEFLARFYVDHM